jgi:hypothetical protein
MFAFVLCLSTLINFVIKGGERAKQLISVPLDISQSKQNLKDALGDTLFTSRSLIHARRLFSIYLLSKSKQTGKLNGFGA